MRVSRWLLLATLLAIAANTLPSGLAAAATTSPAARTIGAPADATQSEVSDGIPDVHPKPMSVAARSGVVPIAGSVAEIVGEHTDQPAAAAVARTLRSAGANEVRTVSDPEQAGDAALLVYVGGPTENPATADALRELHTPGPDGLAAEGYVLAAGKTGQRNVIALSGVDLTGTFYAAQTLRQLVVTRGDTGTVHAVTVRDAPAMALRGVIEGFYGAPWSQADRLSQLDFYGHTKQNTYVYSPKDDPYLRDKWRDPYPADQLATIQALVDRATANHVKFTYALSPGLSVCYSSDADEQALTAKLQSLWGIGVRSFAIPLDDISYTNWNCAADKTKFGTGGAAAGSAQSFLLNRVQTDFIATHAGADKLQMVPTEYYDNTDSPYKTALRTQLGPQVIVEWTGVGVIASQITAAQAARAKKVFGHDILVWDNYPVNDYINDRLLMGPYVGREPGIADSLAGITANPMVQAEPSKIAEFTSGDFAWNPAGYDPDKSWAAAIQEVGGDAAPALKVFAENNYAGVLARLGSNAKDPDSPVLRPLLAAFFAALHGQGDLHKSTGELDDYLVRMAENPAALRKGLAGDPDFLTQVGPWLDKLGLYGQAGQHAVRMLLAAHYGDGARTWSERQQVQQLMRRADSITVPTRNGTTTPQVSVNVFEPFIHSALSTVDLTFGLFPKPAAMTSMGTYSDNVPSRMVDGDLSTGYWSDGAPAVGDYVGVDLGTVRKLTHLDVTMAKPGSPNDYIHAGTLESSSDGKQWTTIGTYTEQPTIRVDLPAGSSARYLRLRDTGSQIYWVLVREFAVTASDGSHYSVTGTPAPATGSSLAAAADGDADSAYVAAAAPENGDLLTVSATAKPVRQVLVLATGSPQASVQVHTTSGEWRTIGTLNGDYTSLPVGELTADAVRLHWAAGAQAPVINEVVW